MTNLKNIYCYKNFAVKDGNKSTTKNKKVKISISKTHWSGLTYYDLHNNKYIKKDIHFRIVLFSLARQIPKLWSNDFYFSTMKGEGYFLIPNDVYIYTYITSFIKGYYTGYSNKDEEVLIKSVVKTLFKIFNSRQKVDDFYKQYLEYNEMKITPPYSDRMLKWFNAEGHAHSDQDLTHNNRTYHIEVETNPKIKKNDKLHMSSLKFYISKKFDIPSEENKLDDVRKKIEKNFPDIVKKVKKKLKHK